ncbi:LysR family transcriptional regulator [Streptomyces sp. NBC_01604]|uniref:helix-turn-helix domain-containing protein n=1 Tax=Streptomyces sp. NBC_01604 TaxID=2975894 RepID=UPI0038655AF3
MLNLVHLKVLAAVARHGSVTEAAREPHYSQPSVSHQPTSWPRRSVCGRGGFASPPTRPY